MKPSEPSSKPSGCTGCKEGNRVVKRKCAYVSITHSLEVPPRYCVRILTPHGSVGPCEVENGSWAAPKSIGGRLNFGCHCPLFWMAYKRLRLILMAALRSRFQRRPLHFSLSQRRMPRFGTSFSIVLPSLLVFVRVLLQSSSYVVSP